MQTYESGFHDISGVLCIGLTYILNNLALKLTAATSVAFLRSLSTVIAPLMAFILFQDGFDRRHIVIHLAVVVGLYLLCGYGVYTVLKRNLGRQ